MKSSTKQFIASFWIALKKLAPEQLLIEGYPGNYLQLLLNNKSYYLHIYAQVLDKALTNSTRPMEDIVLVDYGAGNGLLGMFAKHCGFKKVYLADSSEPFMNAAKQVASQLNILLDGFIVGEETAVLQHFKNLNPPDVIVGTDVIEHIYNLEQFFANLSILNPKLVSVFTTASVNTNPLKRRQLMRLQLNDEFRYSNAAHALPGDIFAGQPFVETRKKIIASQFPKLDKHTVNRLAIATRGLVKQDILAAARQYTQNGTMPHAIKHPTNTCDPITGSWTERLLTTNEFARIYTNTGFTLKVYNGFYNQWQGGIKALVLQMLNKTIALPLGQGKFITPFITLVGKPG